LCAYSGKCISAPVGTGGLQLDWKWLHGAKAQREVQAGGAKVHWGWRGYLTDARTLFTSGSWLIIILHIYSAIYLKILINRLRWIEYWLAA